MDNAHAEAQAWRTALRGAVSNANGHGVGHLVHDAQNSDEGLGALVQASIDELPGISIHRQGFDVPRTFGATGACAVPLSIALAVGRTAHLGEAVVVGVALPDDHGLTAVVVQVASGDPLPSKGTWFRAGSEGFTHLPWWGRRCQEVEASSVLGLPA